MRNGLKLAGVAVIAAFALTACEKDAAKQDLQEPRVAGDAVPEHFEQRVPDKLEVITNVNDHANIVRLCVDGLAFRTVSIKYVGLATPAVERVPEWDAWCAS